MRVFGLVMGLAASALIGAAHAADAPAPVLKDPVDPAPAAFAWSGFHIGGDAGYGLGRTDTGLSIPPLPLPVISTTMNGWVAGGALGHDWQLGPLVLGLETDVAATGQRGTSGLGPATVCPAPKTKLPCVTGSGSIDESLPLFGTFRGRFGITPMDRLLVYVAAGRAVADADVDATLTATRAFPGKPPLATTSISSSSSALRAGWTMGAGAEWALWDHWSAKIEYLRLDFGTVYKTVTGPGGAIGAGSNRITDNVAMIGMNYRFSLAAPAVATRN